MHEDPLAERLHDPHRFGAWVLSCTLGELIGFGATALVALAGVAWFGHPTTRLGHVVALVIMTLAGCLEGASLGYFQSRVLRRALPGVPTRAWVLATTAVAAGGWFVGMLMPILFGGDDTSAPPPRIGVVTYLALAAAMGLVVGALFGLAQWTVLRRHVPRSAGWIGANALGWALGLPWAYAAGRVGGVAIALLGGIAMGVSMAVPTGVYLGALTRRDNVPSA